MSVMGEIAAMIESGSSINDIAGFIQKRDPSKPRREALDMAFKYMREWKKNEHP